MNDEPLIACVGCAVVALRATDGVILWHVPTSKPVTRMYRVVDRIFATAGTLVICIDVHGGRVLGQVELGFPPEAGIACGTDLVLLRSDAALGAEAMVCLASDGTLRWRGTLENDGQHILRTYGPLGEPRSEVHYPPQHGPAGVLYGHEGAQPDRR